MPELKKCRACGVDLPSNAPFGHCPQCLIAMGFGPMSEEAQEPTGRESGSSALGTVRYFGDYELIAVIEPRSHTMSLGTLRHDLQTCCSPADRAIWFRGANLKWDLSDLVQQSVIPARMEDDLDTLLNELLELAQPHEVAPRNTRPIRRRHVVLMSNGSFGGLADKLRSALNT